MVAEIQSFFSTPGMTLKVLMVAIFFVVMFSIGIYAHKKVKNVGDFVLGGRTVGPWLSAFAYGTSYFSAVIFIGYAGRFGWSFGLAATWIGIANALIGTTMSWLVLGERTRVMTKQLDSKTMPDFFEKRYDSKPLKVLASFIIFIYMVPYSASVYTGLGYLFERTFGINYIYCMIAMAVLTAIYLTLGGYMATAINDFIQGFVMLAGIIMIVWFVLNNPNVGGFASGVKSLNEIDPSLTRLFSSNPKDLLGLVVLTSLGVWGLPQMIHKFYSIKDKKSVKVATVVSSVFALIISGGAYFIGSFGRLFLNNEVPIVDGVQNFDAIMPLLLERALPAALMGVVIILVLSASMSTLASVVLTSSSTLSLDFISGTIKKNMSKKSEMIVVRILCLVFVALSVILALSKGAIVTLMSVSWGALAGSFLAPFLYGLFWKGVNRAGALAGMLTGVSVTTISVLVPSISAVLSPPNAGALAMLLSLIIVPVVSLLTTKVEKFKVDSEKIDFAFACLEKKDGV